MAVQWLKTNATKTKVLDDSFEFSADTFKMALLTSASNIGAGSTTYAGLTGELAQANGYLTGGKPITFTFSGTTTRKASLAADPVWTASGGDLIARYAVIYEVGGDVLCYCLLDETPADVGVSDGNELTVITNANGIFFI